jgi:undecaprenyl-diphosphatase
MRQKNQFWLIAMTIITGGALACLLLLTVLDRSLDTEAVLRFDTHGQALVHSWTNPYITALALALTWLGAIKIFAVAVGLVVGFIFVQGRRHAALLLGFAITGAFLLNEGLKVHFHRARPKVFWSIGDEHTYSFPSGHSFFAVVLYGTLC